MKPLTEDYNLVVRALIENGVTDCYMLDSNKIKEFEEVAEKMYNNGALLESIKVYTMTKNKKKLIELGKEALEKHKIEYAFEAFKSAKDTEGLIKAGNAFLCEGRIRNAYYCFKLSGDEIMMKFFEANWKEGIDYYL